ncbi:ParB/RepB/Spo0J family partition protein [Patescibacteria group bacterium]|nr:ParB/RepB/Spo0J family partition protein [Patescibacteria group bacterium]MBU2633597.1 ParB/RepB/Spo0J family partition protein [Patescibacteria group bacterium]
MSDYELPRIRKESGVFWVEVEKIKPNTMQPRKVFNEDRLKELSESIRQYGVLQPLVVIRHEKEVPSGAFVEYEIIAGERRWRASQIAGLTQVPVIIREDSSEKIKLELALIENLQREDLSPMERAVAFKQLISDFKMRHHEVGAKVGKSREFVSNTIRLLGLPEEIQEGLRSGLINEGHTRPLLSLSKQQEDQIVLYKEIIYRKMNVREAEEMSRKLVRDRVARRTRMEIEDPESQKLGQQLSDVLGARVMVERKGPTVKKISMEFFSEEELQDFLSRVGLQTMQQQFTQETEGEEEENLEEAGFVMNESVEQADAEGNKTEQTEPLDSENTQGGSLDEIEKKEGEEKGGWLKYFSV